MNPRLESLIHQVPGWNPAAVSVTPLNGGITNENHRVDTKGESFVLRINGKGTENLGINRSHEYECAATAARQGIGPEVIYCFPHGEGLVTRFLEGETISRVAAAEPHNLRRIVTSIRKIHYGKPFPGTFSPFKAVRHYHKIGFVSRRFGSIVPGLPSALKVMRRIEDTLALFNDPRPCHNDLLATNLIDDGKIVRIIDWEYAAMGDPFFDLGNFAINQQLSQDRCRLLLKEYFGQARPRDFARLQLYRLASDMREAFWGFMQSSISEIEFDFVAYGVKHIDRFLRNASGPQFDRWLKEASSKLST